MVFARPTRSDLLARVSADLASRLGLGALLPRSNLTGFAGAEAGLSHALHGHAAWVADQILPDTADSENLERWGSHFAIVRKAATFSQGGVDFTGVNGSVIPLGTVVQRADGQRFETSAQVTIAAGLALAQVQAQVAGVLLNSDPATLVNLSSPISGVDTVAAVATGGLTAGADREPDEDLLARIQVRLQTPPQGGASADYKAWALEVAGVSRAWALPLHQGPGTVGVTFVLDDAATIIPTAAKVTEVQTYIDALRPATATVVVFAPGELGLDITVTITPDTADIRAAVLASLEDMLNRFTEPGKVLPLSVIGEAISAAQGETSHVLTVPAADLAPVPGTIVTMGTPTWT